jgi:WD40 repeat protein
MRWAKDPEERHVFWLNGLAGTGKSTIAQTFSEMVAKAGTLGASFFCSRDYLDRKELKNIFPTLAYQLACHYPTFRTQIIRAIKQDPTVARNALISQLEVLIVDPLSSTNISCIIVVDALDECVDDQPASAILSVLGRFVNRLPSVKFFITGRPEPRIRTGFRLPLLEPLTQVFLLHKVEPSEVDEDIRLYLEEKLSAVVKRRSDLDLSDPWPLDQDLAALTKKSSGLFIFASTLVRFVGSEHHEPGERLQLIVTPSDSTVHEGRAGIDPLYAQVLMHAFSDVEETTVFTNLRRVLGAVILAFNPLSRAQIAKILDINTPLITTTLRHLHSVLLVPNEGSKEIRVFHKSFPDFLQDRGRCSNSSFFIDSSVHHGNMALGCLELLKRLKRNPCGLPDFVMNKEVLNLPDLLEDSVGSGSRYACGYWAMHVRLSPTTNNYAIQLVASAIDFFKSDPLPWIEVMSLENRLESMVHSIYKLFDWIGMVCIKSWSIRKPDPFTLQKQVRAPTSELYSLAEDCLRFTMHFFHLIQQSALHMYHSTLPLSSTSSMFHRMILPDKTLVTGFYGRPDTWGATLRTIGRSSEDPTYMTTFGHRIAAAWGDGTVDIYDSVTGVLRLSMSPPHQVKAISGSPDGFTLFCLHGGCSITLWDMQTGGIIHTLVLEEEVKGIAVSSNGRYLACGLSGGSVKIWDITNKTEGVTIPGRFSTIYLCWLEPEERLAVVRDRVLDVDWDLWDVVSGRILHSSEEWWSALGVVYSQDLGVLAIATGPAEFVATIETFDPQTGTPSGSYKVPQGSTRFAFSRTSKELVCDTNTRGLQLLDISTGRWRNFEYPHKITFLSSLPNGTIVAGVLGSGIQFLNLDERYTPSRQPSESAPTVHALDRGNVVLVFSADWDHILLLESATMSEFITIHYEGAIFSTDWVEVLCASLENRTAIYCFKREGEGRLHLWRSHDRSPKWSMKINELPSIGEISPSGARLVTFHNVDSQTHIYVWDTQDGKCQRRLRIDKSIPFTNPLEIKFESEGRFYSHYDTYRIPYDLDFSHGGASRAIFRRPQQPLGEQLHTRQYDVDDNHEWVVSGSRRVCWIPPGYIKSGEGGHYWAGSALAMAGQDGMLRILNFRS